jgi:hypothetical protein
MVYNTEARLSTGLNYDAPRVQAYDESRSEESHQDALDQLDEAHDMALVRSAKYR